MVRTLNPTTPAERSHYAIYEDIPTPQTDSRVIGAPGKTTRTIAVGDDSPWVARVQFFPLGTMTRRGYNGWGCHIDVYRIDTIRPERKRQGSYGAPLGQIGWADGGVSVGHAPNVPATTVEEIIVAAEGLIAEHGAAWEAAWLPRQEVAR